MPLTDAAVRNAKPGVKPDGTATSKPYKMGKAHGLYLEVPPSGGKRWRLKYRFGGKEKRLALSVYPDVTLADARRKRDEARRLLAGGIAPGEHRELTRNTPQDADSFEAVAREWFAKFVPGWAPTHSEKIIRRLERDIFPWIRCPACWPDRRARAADRVLRRIETRGRLETAHRAHQDCGRVFRYAVATGRAERDPSGDLRGALAPWKPKHYATYRPAGHSGIAARPGRLHRQSGDRLRAETRAADVRAPGRAAPGRVGRDRP